MAKENNLKLNDSENQDKKQGRSKFPNSRKAYTIKFKIEALQSLSKNLGNKSKTARECGISTKMLRDWENKKMQLFEIREKSETRKMKSGKTAKYPKLEEYLLNYINDEINLFHRAVSMHLIRQKGFQFVKENNLELCFSNYWMFNFLKRKNLTYRKITSVGQETNTTNEELKQQVIMHLDILKICHDVSETSIFNMDEISLYIDTMPSKTISIKGMKNVESLSTGHCKTRLTFFLLISADGKMHKSLVILKDRKNVPKVSIPSNIVVIGSDSGTMNQELMNEWMRKCFPTANIFQQTSNSVLIMDHFGSHKTDNILKSFKKYNTTPIYIPQRTTAFLQPLDILVNFIFKNEYRKRWNEWMSVGEKIYTKSGYRQKPGWDLVFKWISEALLVVKSDVIIKAYKSGIFGKNSTYEKYQLNRIISKLEDKFNKEDEEIIFDNKESIEDTYDFI